MFEQFEKWAEEREWLPLGTTIHEPDVLYYLTPIGFLVKIHLSKGVLMGISTVTTTIGDTSAALLGKA